jgi:hypothetical protein
MDLAGLRVVMDADFSAVYAAFNQANGMMQDFANNVKNAFNSIPDFKSKFNFTSNGASQAAQDAREYARAARDQAAADLDAAKAKKILEDQQRRNEQATKKEKDAYGQLVADSNALVRAYYNAAAAIIKDGDAAGITAEKLEEMRKAALDGQEQLKGIEAGVGRFQRNVGNYASAVSGYFGQTLVRSAHAAAEAMVGMQRGVNALAVDLPNLITEFQRMVAEQKAIKASGGQALSVTQLLAQAFNPLTLAIQFGVIALVKYGPELYRMATGAEEAKKKAEALKKAQDELNEAFNSGVREVAGNITQVQALSTAIKDANLPMQTRIDKYNQLIALYPGLFTQINNELDAHDKLNSTYPALFDNLDNHKGKINALDAAVNKLTKDLYQQAIAQGFSKQLEKIGEDTAVLKAHEIELQQTVATTSKAFEKALTPYKNFYAQIIKSSDNTKGVKKNLDELNKGYRELLKNPKVAAGGDAIGQIANAAAAASKALKDNQDAQKQSADKASVIIEAQNKLVEALAHSTTATTNYKDAAQHQAEAATAVYETTLKGTQAHQEAAGAYKIAQKNLDDYTLSAKEAKAALTALQELIQANKETDADLFTGATNMGDALKSKISNYQSYIKALLLGGVNATSHEIQNAFEVIDTLSAKLAEPIDTSGALVKVKKEYQDLADAAYKSAEKIGEASKLTRKNLKDALAEEDVNAAAKKLEKLQDEMARSLASGFENAAAVIGEGFVNLASGAGNIGDIFKGIGQILGDQIIALGKQLIIAGGIMEVAQKAIKTLFANPIASVAAGIAVIAVGSALKAALSKKASGVGKFANGGVIYGQTLGIMGEYAGASSNPEVVAPLSKLTSILRQQNLGGGQQVFIPDMRISGQDLLVVFKRANKSFDR